MRIIIFIFISLSVVVVVMPSFSFAKEPLVPATNVIDKSDRKDSKVMTKAELEERGRQLRVAIEGRYKAENGEIRSPSIIISDVIIKYIPLGSSFEDISDDG